MALHFVGHELSITTEVFPPPLSIIQGSDSLNLTFHLDYNGARDALLENSTVCQELNKTTLFLSFVITLPVVFDILYPTNVSNHTGSIVTEFSNCSYTPSLGITSSVVGRHLPGFHILRFDILSQNVNWTTTLHVQLRVLHSVRSGSLLNITANATITNETSTQFNVASYRVPTPGNLRLELKSTSIPETPNSTLTTDEEVTLTASFELPRITANITLSITLPTFGNSTPMKFIGGSVKGLPQGIVPQRLAQVGLPPLFGIISSNLHRFPHSLNVAKFVFGETVNTQANDSISRIITVEVTGMVDSSQGEYVPEIEGNVTCTLTHSNTGLDIVAYETVLSLELGQPLLMHQFVIEGSGCCYEGNDNVTLTFEVKNPNISTAPALNVSISFDASSPHISVLSISAVLCGPTTSNATGNQSSVYGKVICMDFNGTELMTISSTGLTINSPRLNASSWIQGRVLTFLKPSVSVGSSHDNLLTLKYSRTGWLPLVFLETQSIQVTSVVSQPPSVIGSNVPPLDGGVITIGEEMTVQMSVSLPVSTNSDFTFRVFGQGVEGVAGKITHVGNNIESPYGEIRGAEFNVTSEVKGKFGTIVNTGNFSKPYDNVIEYQVTLRASNGSRNTNGHIMHINFAVIAGGINQLPERSLSLQVIEPDLSVIIIPSRFTGVPPDYDITFTVQLTHSMSSTSDAYRVLLEIAVPHDHLSNAKITDFPGRESIALVNGNQAPSGRYNNPSTKVLVYQSNDLPRDQTVSFKYKATTVNNLQRSIFVSSPVHLAYVTLPNILAPREGRKYMHELHQGTFLTLRPDPFVSVTFKPPNGSFDAGDRVQFDLTLKNVHDQSSQAFDLSVVVTFEGLDENRIYITCTTGSPAFNATSGESKLIISKVDPLQTVYCNYTSFLQNRISPKRLISQTVDVEYFSLSSASNPQRASYKERRYANFTTKPINATIMTSQNAETLQAGDPVNFTLHLQIPECVTTLTVSFNLPTVPLGVIDLARRRRAIGSEDVSYRSRVKRSAAVLYVLTPLLSESYVKHGNGLTVQMSPTISRPQNASLNITFGLVENLPGSGTNDTVEIFLKFTTANKSLVLSGRPLYLTAILNFDVGFDEITKKFLIIGPLLKPLLSISKTVEILKQEGDSPPVVFNVTVSHASGSLYDARNLTVTDTTQGMDLFDSDVSSKGSLASSPRENIFVIRFTLASLKIGETRSFVYVGRFKVDQKEPSTLRIPAEVTWKSVQLNSPVYRLLSETGTACLQRNNVEESEPRKVFGFFALGVILGLLIGGVIAAILVLTIIKCCDKGKMAPYYMRFTNTSTMTVLTGGSQYVYHGEDLPTKTPIEKHAEPSIVQTDESIVPILTLDNATQTEKEFNSLDVQSTAALDVDLETQRQNMFIKAIKLLVKKLRVKRDISTEQECNFVLEIKQIIGSVSFKMAAEYKRKSAELRKKLQTEGKNRFDALQREQKKEREETENKIKGLVNEREKENILELLKKRQEAQEQELKQNLKLEQDVEMEKLRKEVSISKRLALKEAQNKLIQNLIKDANLNEDQANAILKDHLANMATIDKATDEDRARRVMALEMRLAERRALARQKQEDEARKRRDLVKLQENHSDALENLVRSSTLSSEDAAVYLERFKKEMEATESKLAKDRKRQEQKLHQKLTALKQRKVEEKAREHQRQIKEFDDQQDQKFEHVEIDAVTAITEKQKLLEKQRQEIEEIDRNSDREAARKIESLRDQQTREANQLMMNNAQRMYRELLNKGLSESEKEAILERHMADLTMQQDAREQERRRQRDMLERRLEKQRATLEKKMKEEQAEQAEIRKQEDKIVGDLIVNQVVMSEDERDRIIQEHEKNLAELESSLTLNKLRQRQMLEEKLSERRRRRMEQLEKRQIDETKDRDYADKILVEGEDIEIIKKHEQEKMAALNEDEVNLEDEMDAVREEMLAERAKKLEEHHEKLGAVIAQLQIEKAKQMSKIAMQQEALGQLQAGLIDELESKGTFQDPETQKIMEKYQKETKNLEETLKQQKERQEQVLRNRLQQRMKQREETLVLQQKDELSQYISNLNVSNMAMKLRKAAMKARHEKELNDLRNRMQKEIDQSIKELKMSSDIRRMEAIETQNLKLISILVQQGKLQEEEIEGVLEFLFPTKSSNEIDELLSKIYGPNYTKNSGQSFSLASRRESTLEARIRRNSSFPNAVPPIRKKRKKTKKNEHDQSKELPPVNFKGGKRGFSLNESLRGYRSLTDEEQRSTRNEPRDDDEQRVKPIISRKGSYQRLTEETNQEKVDGMFGDSSERSRKKSGKKHKRRSREDEDVQA